MSAKDRRGIPVENNFVLRKTGRVREKEAAIARMSNRDVRRNQLLPMVQQTISAQENELQGWFLLCEMQNGALPRAEKSCYAKPTWARVLPGKMRNSQAQAQEKKGLTAKSGLRRVNGVFVKREIEFKESENGI